MTDKQKKQEHATWEALVIKGPNDETEPTLACSWTCHWSEPSLVYLIEIG
jgi:hypothetical protein